MNQASPDPGRLLDLAEAAAREAASMLAARRSACRPGVVATKSSPTDVVTEADRTAETMIIERIRADRPGDAFLGEEGGQSDASAGSEAGLVVRWIIDPLDGTVNYLYGLPDFAVSIAAEVDGEIVAGVVHMPERGEVFTAVTGGGAWLRAAGLPPEPMRCNSGVPLARALVATGFGYAAPRRRVQGEVVAALLPLVRDIRRAGSAAVRPVLARGRPGGRVLRARGELLGHRRRRPDRPRGRRYHGRAVRPPGRPDSTVAAGPGLFDELTGQLARLNPLRDG